MLSWIVFLSLGATLELRNTRNTVTVVEQTHGWTVRMPPCVALLVFCCVGESEVRQGSVSVGLSVKER